MLLLLETPSKKKKNLTVNVTSMLRIPLCASPKKSPITLFFKHSSIKKLRHASSLPPHPHSTLLGISKKKKKNLYTWKAGSWDRKLSFASVFTLAPFSSLSLLPGRAFIFCGLKP